MTEPNLMPSDDVTSEDAANEAAEVPTARAPQSGGDGRIADALADAVVRFAEAQQESLVVLQQLSKSVAELRSARQDEVDKRRLMLELDALRREPKVPLGWLATRLRVLARKGLRRTSYRKIDFQLLMERCFDESGIPATVAWVEDAVLARDVSPQVAYSLLLPALVLRNDLATAQAVANRVQERYPDNATLRTVIDRVRIGGAEETPKISGDFIVWKSRLGPRKHKLVLPRTNVGQAAWDRAKSLQGLRTRPSVLTALTVGSPKLVALFDDYLNELRSTPSSWRQGLIDWAPDLIILDYSAVADTNSDERVNLQELVAACNSTAALPLLWVDSRSVSAAAGAITPMVPSSVVTLADTQLTLRHLRDAGFQGAVHVVGPATDTRHRVLAEASKHDTLVLWDASANADVLNPIQAAKVLPNWRTYAWTGAHLAGRPVAESPIAERIETENPQREAAARECLAIAGDLGEVTHEELMRLGQTLARGSALFVHRATVPTLTGPLKDAPYTPFDSLEDLSRVIGSLDETPQAIARAQHSCARFARERLGKRAAFARVLAHAGAPSIGRNTRRVSVLCVSNRPEQVRHCLETYKSQTYPHRELIFVANVDVLEDAWVEQFIAESPDVTLLRTNDEYSLGESLNRARAVASGELWTKLDDDDHYGANYLRDLVAALDHAEAAVAGKGTFYTFDKGQNKLYLNQQTTENSMTDRFVQGGTILADRRFVENIEFQPVRHGTDSLFLQHCKLQGLKIYCADRYNYAYIRYPSPDHHTYAVKNESYLKRCSFICDGFDKALIDL